MAIVVAIMVPIQTTRRDQVVGMVRAVGVASLVMTPLTVNQTQAVGMARKVAADVVVMVISEDGNTLYVWSLEHSNH